MGSYESAIGTLEAELTAVADVLAGLTPEQWQRSTLLVPVDPDLPKWTVFELAETFTNTVSEARAVPPSLVGPGYFAPMRVDEFVASRIVEAVVHGIDLAQALGSPYFATADGIALTAAILDDLLARRTTGSRPAALSDDLEWILAASGRAPADDSRLPLIG